LLQVLGDARTRALVGRDLAGLAAVHRPGGPSWTSDREVVQTLRSTGTRWEGLRLEVATATYVPPAGPARASAAVAAPGARDAVVRARVDWTAYTVVTDGGARAPRAAEEGELLDFHLVRGAQGWRIESISRAPAT
jgi:serine/threonine-protein kinase